MTVELDEANVAAWENVWRTKPPTSAVAIIRAATARDERGACFVALLRSTYPKTAGPLLVGATPGASAP